MPRGAVFSRINSEPVFTPHHRLLAVNNVGIVDRDSYVELRVLFRNYPHEVGRSSPLGVMSLPERRALIATVQQVPTLTEVQKDLIAQRLG